MKSKTKSGVKPASEGSKALPNFLFIVGITITAAVFLESYLQLTGSKVTLLTIAHDYGLLTDYKLSKEPNRGIWHPIGWIGSVSFITMMLYSFRKRIGFMQDVGPLRYWLDVHMFLGITGTLLITAHSTYKVGGIVSLSFWSMILVTSSGFIGRYLYIQIPRSISGNELRMDEIESLMSEINVKMERVSGKDHELLRYFELVSGPKSAPEMSLPRAIFAILGNDIANRWRLLRIRYEISRIKKMPRFVKRHLYKLVREKGKLTSSVNFLSASHRLLHYWHVFHKPFAIIMFLVMFLHIAIFYLFRSAV